MHALGFGSFKAETSMKEMERHTVDPNTSSAEGVVQLLVGLQQGKVLEPRERTLLFDMMSRARTGLKRIVAGVPSGTEVLHKTGTGNNAVNDVGLITLPGKQGHVAIAVMISDSKLATADQERAVAEAAKVIYEAWGTRALGRSQRRSDHIVLIQKNPMAVQRLPFKTAYDIKNQVPCPSREAISGCCPFHSMNRSFAASGGIGSTTTNSFFCLLTTAM
jgi:hypothetical protein